MIFFFSVISACTLFLSALSFGPADIHHHAEAINQGYVKKYDLITYSSLSIHKATSSKRGVWKGNDERLDTLSQTQLIPESTDSFLLEITAYEKTFCLHMHPNYELLHPSMKPLEVNKEGASRVAVSAMPFKGFVVDVLDHNSQDEFADIEYECRWFESSPQYENYADSLGWARLVVVPDKVFKSVNPRTRKLDQVNHHSPVYEGTFYYGDQHYTIKTIDRYSRTRRYYDEPISMPAYRAHHQQHAQLMIFRTEDMRMELPNYETSKLVGQKTCGADELEFNALHANEFADHKFESFLKSERSAFLGSNISPKRESPLEVGSKKLQKRAFTGCPTAKKVLYMGVIMDCTYINVHGSSTEAQTQVLNNWNTVSAIYESSFNIFLGLIQIEAMATCETDNSKNTIFNQVCSSGYTINSRLSDFSKWRGESQDDSAGLWHLMSNCSTGSTIGLAWLNMLCQTTEFSQTNSDGSVTHVSGTGVSTIVTNEFMVVAHEIGHNFGGSHDCTSSLCASCTGKTCSNCCQCQSQCDCNDQFIMNPTNGVSPINPTFSYCSQNDMCTNNPVFGTCLQELGTRTVLNSGVCGNGALEGTEECDCGGIDGCELDQDPCCYKNCTLKAEAVCSDNNFPCCLNCQVLNPLVNRTCRATATECDVPEFCAGEATCPKEIYKPDGQGCGNSSDTKCASGICTSRALQCKVYGGADVLADCASYSGQCGMFCNTKLDGCVKYAGSFRDGTPCGSNGVCTKGQCSNPDLIGKVTQWALNNQRMAIAIIVIVTVVLFCGGSYFLKNLRAEKNVVAIKQAKLEEDELSRLAKFERKKQMEDRKNRREQYNKPSKEQHNAALAEMTRQSNSSGGSRRA